MLFAGDAQSNIVALRCGRRARRCGTPGQPKVERTALTYGSMRASTLGVAAGQLYAFAYGSESCITAKNARVEGREDMTRLMFGALAVASIGLVAMAPSDPRSPTPDSPLGYPKRAAGLLIT